MAAKKKKPAPKKPAPRKSPAKKPAKKAAKTPARKPAKKPARKPAPAKKPAARALPMHARVSHPELDDGGYEEVFETFKAFDRDGSGSIDRGELARLLEALGQPIDEEELDIALDVIDANHSGRVSWSEFKAWWTDR